MSLFTTYIALGIAIALEVVGTSALQASQQFTRTVPTIVMAVSYLSAFYFLSLALRTIPVGIAYAIWSGLGIVLIAIVGLVVFKQGAVKAIREIRRSLFHQNRQKSGRIRRNISQKVFPLLFHMPIDLHGA